MRETDRTPAGPVRDDLREGVFLWTSEQKIVAAIIFSWKHTVVSFSMDNNGTVTNHGVLGVGKEGPTASVKFLDDEGIRDERGFLLCNVPAIPDVADIRDGDDIHRRRVL